MRTLRRPTGFVLIELIATLILIGIIGAFTGLFLYKGIEGFIDSKRNSETALKAQIAIDRISAELRHVTDITNWTGTSLTYKSSDLLGTRKLVFDTAAGEIRISIDGGTELVLLDQLKACTLAYSAAEIDRAPDGKEDLRSITVAFTLKDVGKEFRVNVFPRHLVPKPT